MSSEPAYYPLLRILIGLAGAALVLVVMTALGMLVDAPVRAVVDEINARTGVAGTLAFALCLPVSGCLLAHWARRRDERCRIAETGQMEHRHRPFSQDGWARNLAILLAPLVVLVAIGLAMWLTGTPLPRAILR